MIRIGVDVGGTKIEAVALDAGGSIVERERVPTPRDYEETLAAITDLVRRLENRIGSEARVGIATPGAISPATGRIKNANSVCLNGMPLAEDLEARLGRKLRIANDADCFALSEAVDGAARGTSPVFGVILGTGVGGGVIIDGRPLRGPNAIAGEWGHNPLPWPALSELPGPRCYCGKHGCVETFLSGPGLAADHRAATGQITEPRRIVAAADDGDPAARATLDRYEERLARALAVVINILDPRTIVLGGGLSGIRRLYERVPRLWGKHVFSDQVDTRLVPPVHGDASGVRGAAWLWNTD